MELNSKTFEKNGIIPIEFTGEGNDSTPHLQWKEAPISSVEYALICEDPDAPKRIGKDHPFVHWLVYNIPKDVHELPEKLTTSKHLTIPVKADQGTNSFGSIGYGGPLPPLGDGEHHYIFTLFALNAPLKLHEGATKHELIQAMRGHVIATAQLVGRYERAHHAHENRMTSFSEESRL